MTIGEYRVRAGFNPSGNELVDEIKAKTAALIDLCETFGMEPRLVALAQTAYEQGAMWAVKAATAEGPLLHPGAGFRSEIAPPEAAGREVIPQTLASGDSGPLTPIELE